MGCSRVLNFDFRPQKLANGHTLRLIVLMVLTVVLYTFCSSDIIVIGPDVEEYVFIAVVTADFCGIRIISFENINVVVDLFF
jgi:hypothetical protein